MITNFAIFKNTKATGNQPPYDMVAKDENGKSLRLASIWLKDHNGTKFYSGQMKNEFVKTDGTKLDGYVIISLSEYKKLKGESGGADEIPF